MQKKLNKSYKKTVKKKPQQKKNKCQPCSMKYGFPIHIQNALCRKYSSYHFSELKTTNELLTQKQTDNQPKQYLQKYYKTVHRRHSFPKLKQIYSLHVEVPRLFMSDTREITQKCHHRKRLLEYFKIAKKLNLKVQSVKFSTFLLSVSKTHPNPEHPTQYQKIIHDISHYDFTEEIEKNIIETMTIKPTPNLSSYRNLQIVV